MYKISCIYLFSALTILSCATSGKVRKDETVKKQSEAETVLKTADRNLTNSGFFIQKGRIKAKGEAGIINLMFTMKFLPDGKFLISLRSRTGMEAFRVFLSRDSVLVNDRLNKTVLYGNKSDFEKIIGIPAELLKISIGDIFIGTFVAFKDTECRNNQVFLNDYYKGLIIKTLIDCRLYKAKSVNLSSGVNDEYVLVKYMKHREDKYGLPRKIEVDDLRRNTRIVIKTDKYLAPWYGEIEFIPGSGYAVKPLI